MVSSLDEASSATPRLFTRASLGGFNAQLLKRASSNFSPDVFLLSKGEESYVLKDYAPRPAWVRWSWGRLVISREVKAYQRLNGLKAVPAFYGKVDSCAFVMEHVKAGTLPRRKQGEALGVAFFEQLFAALAEMHSRGVAHGDIRKNNILVREDGSPCILDYQTCVFDGADPVRRRIFRHMVYVDNLTALKLKRRFLPRTINEHDHQLLDDPPVSLKIGRFLRKRVYRPLSPKVLKPKSRRTVEKITGNR